MMKIMANLQNGIVAAFLEQLKGYFINDKPSVQSQLIMFSISIFILNRISSVREMYTNCISKFVNIHINNFYKAFKEEEFQKYWIEYTVKLALALIPDDFRKYPIYLIIDDTLIEKFGTHFDDFSKLYDHCRRNGTDFIFGHCFVSIVLLIPVYNINRPGCIEYIRIPLEHRLWIPKNKEVTKKDEQNKLQIAKDMIENVINIMKKYGFKIENETNESNKETSNRDMESTELSLSDDSNTTDKNHTEAKDATNNDTIKLIILCDAWYSKGEIIDLVTRKDDKVNIIASVRIDTKMFDSPEYCGRGRKPLHGKPISAKKDSFDGLWVDVPGQNYKVAYFRAQIGIFDNQEAAAFVTQNKTTGERRLFLCSDPDYFKQFTPASLQLDAKTAKFLEKHPEIIPLLIYKRRWAIETVYFEQKKYWGLQNYMLRRENGFTSLVNLNNTLYALTSMLPYLDKTFAYLASLSMQERRSALGSAFYKDLIFSKFLTGCEHMGNYEEISKYAMDFCNNNGAVM